MEFAKTAKALGLAPITGAEVTLTDGHHLTLLAETQEGYRNLCRLLTAAHRHDRRTPALDPALLADHACGLIALSGCRSGEVPSLVQAGRLAEAEAAASRHREWFGPQGYYLELQHNLVYGDDERIRGLLGLAQRLDLPVVATNDAHYHVRERSRLQDVLVAIGACATLEATHQQRRPNSEFALKPPQEMAALFTEHPVALRSTLAIAERCRFDLTGGLGISSRPTRWLRAPPLTAIWRTSVMPPPHSGTGSSPSARGPGWRQNWRWCGGRDWPASSCCTGTSWCWPTR